MTTRGTLRRTAAAPAIGYVREGETGPRVLLLMGFGMRGAVWQPQIEGLGRDHQLCWFDNRGVGDSHCPPGPWTMRLLAEDALRVMDAAGWDSAHLVGVSMGGMMAQELALMARDRFHSLTLVATHAGGPGCLFPTARGLRCFVRAQTSDRRERIRAVTELLYPPEFVAQTDLRALGRRMKESLGSPTPRATLLSQFAAVTRHDTRARLRQLSLPTLVVRPGLDILVRPEHSDQLHRLIPGARMLRYDDAGHGVIFQRASDLNQELRAHFLAAEAPLMAAGSRGRG